VISLGRIKKNSRVLDAGCGVGGASLYISQHTGAEVFGISIVEDQLAVANKIKLKRGLKNIDFSNQDFTKTNFKNGYFDVIFGIESVCHAYPKSEFLKEACRVLKPGGELIIIDGYKRREVSTDIERVIDNDFCRGWKLQEMCQAPH
jgi:tocopherol O-methyltransferase